MFGYFDYSRVFEFREPGLSLDIGLCKELGVTLNVFESVI